MAKPAVRGGIRSTRRWIIDLQWVVVLETAATSDGQVLARGSLERLCDAMGEHGATIVGNERRYSLQIQVEAVGEAEALFYACARWKDTARTLGLPTWSLTRAEVATVEEFQRDRAQTPALAIPDRLPDAPALDLLPRALQDSLTGLVSRELFSDCVRSVLAGNAGADPYAVLVLDLDNFAAFNESESSAVGDRLLAVLAARISRTPEHTMVARLGGDEFAVLVREAVEGDADQVAHQLLETIRTPAALGGRMVAVTASVGYATSADLSHPDDLIRDAAIAMCLAKSDGGDCCRRFQVGVSVDLRRLDFDADPAPDRLAHVLLLERAALAANECQTLEDAASIVVQEVCAHTGWPLGHLSVIDRCGEQIEPTSIWHTRGPDRFGPFRAAVDATAFGPAEGLSGKVVELAGFACFGDGPLSFEVPGPILSAAAACGVKAGCGFPITVSGDVVAVLEFYTSRAGRVSEALREVMRGVCAQLARVAERSHARAALSRSEAKYHTLADSVPVLMWVSGLDGTCTFVNSAWLRFTGRTLEDSEAGWASCIHPDDLPACLERYKSAFAERKAFQMQYRLRRVDGEYRAIFDQARPVGVGGAFEGYVGAGVDMTELEAGAQRPRSR